MDTAAFQNARLKPPIMPLSPYEGKHLFSFQLTIKALANGSAKAQASWVGEQWMPTVQQKDKAR